LAVAWRDLTPELQRLLAAFVLHPEPLSADWLNSLVADASAIDALMNRDWIEEKQKPDGRWQLREQIDRAKLRRVIPWSIRQETHRRLAALGLRDSETAAIAAAHLESAGDAAAAGEAWLLAARRELKVRRGQAAVEAVAQSLRLWTTDSSHADFAAIGEILARCATFPGAGDSLLNQLEEWLSRDPWQEHSGFVGQAGPLLADLLASRARHAAGAEVRLRTAKILRTAGDAAGAARQATAAAATLTFGYHFTAARRAFDEAIASAEAAGEPALLAEACIGAGLLWGMRGDAAAGRVFLERALDIALPLKLTGLAAEAYRVLGSVAEYSSCYGDEQKAFSRALAYCRRHDATDTEDICLGCLSYSLFRSGNWTRSREVARRVLVRKRAPEASRCVAEGVLGLLHAHRGELRDAVRLLESSNARASRTGLVGMAFFNLWGLALVEEQAGRPIDAGMHYRRLFECWRATEDRHDAIPGLTSAALFFARQGDRDTLGKFSEALQEIARAGANPEARAAAALATAEGLRIDGDGRDAVQRLQDALADYRRCGLVMERVRALICLGHAERAAGNASAARSAWREVRQRAGRLGVRALVAEVETALSLVLPSTAAKTEQVGSPNEILSARQWEVVRGLCAGLTNKEIATRLGLSVRTVDMHVAHILSRLDCRSRTEVAARVRLEPGADTVMLR
jgi:DNA-binding NarL/FixJ family response regulator